MLKGLNACLVLVIFLAATPVMAAEALVGHYKDHTGLPITVSVLNDGRARIDLDEEVYFLFTGSNIWAVSSWETGDWEKVDFAARTKTALVETPGILQKYTRVNVKDTGYAKDIAGYRGKVFEASVAGTGESYQVVVADDRDVARLSPYAMVFFQDLNRAPGNRDVVEIISAGAKTTYGILSLDKELTLIKIERRNYNEAYFELPAALKD